MSTPRWEDIIKGAIERSLDGVHTAIPAKVSSYLPALQQCVCQSVIEGMPILEDVPVLWPRGGGAFLHFPLESGDSVLLVFCEQDFSPWRLSGGVQAPALLRRHGLFAYAIPGAAPDIAPLIYPAALKGPAFGEDAGTVVQVASGVAKVGVAIGPGLPVLTAFEFTALMDTLVTWLSTHTHTSAAPGSPTTMPIDPPTPPSAVGSAVLGVTS